jgi:predicted dehydrogenase
MTNIGVCGIGSIGARHVQVFSAIRGITVTAYDAVAGAGQIEQRAGRTVRIARSFEQLLDLCPDGVVIASPDAAHLSQLVQACERDIPVLLEKPVAPSAAEAEERLLETSADFSRVLVGYVLHYYRCMNRAKQLLRDGAIGTVVSFHVDLGAYDTLPSAVNRFAEAAFGTLYVDYSHEWDYIGWLFGEISGGFALETQSGALPYTQNPNVVNAVLRTTSGVIGTAHLDYVRQPTRRAFAVVGDRGELSVDVRAGLISITTRGTKEVEEVLLPESPDEPLRAQAEHFRDVSARLAEPLVTIADGMAALRVADALRQSARCCRWVGLRPESWGSA